MKKLKNILFKLQFLILIVGTISSNFSQTWNPGGQNTTSYTADVKTNHIFEVTKIGTAWQDKQMTVHLEKLKFTPSSGDSVGWGTGNPLPVDGDGNPLWMAYVKSVKDDNGDLIPDGNIRNPAMNHW